jgi:hypothetical protein
LDLSKIVSYVPSKTSAAYHKFLFENKTPSATNQTRKAMDEAQIREVGENPPPVHPISIPKQDEITQPLHLFGC